MFKYLKHFFEDIQVNAYNLFHGNSDKSDKIYPRLSLEDEDENLSEFVYDEKQLRIDTLLFIKQYKNTYYKYTDKSKFNPELYNSFTNETNFDGGDTAYDDDDNNTRIFDRYIFEYMKNRNDLMTHLQCKNKEIDLKNSLEHLEDVHKKDTKIDVLFLMDMNDKELFKYCYAIVKEKHNIAVIKSVLFSVIFKHDGEYIRVKLNSFSKNKQNHPYLVLENIL